MNWQNLYFAQNSLQNIQNMFYSNIQLGQLHPESNFRSLKTIQRKLPSKWSSGAELWGILMLHHANAKSILKVKPLFFIWDGIAVICTWT